MSHHKSKADFEYKDGSKLFWTSDQHFCHTNIIKFCNRPFKTIEEMDKTLIDNWNKTVPVDGLVFHLGDFAWGGYNVWKSVREQLNGRIILIKGNHDIRNLTSTSEELFDFVTQQMTIEVEGRKIVLNHYPLLCYAGTYRDPKDMVWALSGHTHIGPLSMDGKDISRLKLTFPTQYDVGVDMNDFKPISFAEVSDRINFQVENNVNMLHWI